MEDAVTGRLTLEDRDADHGAPLTDNAPWRALADRQEITAVLHTYCRAIDRLDVVLGHSIWNEESYADYGTDFYQGPGPGAIDLICRQHRQAINHHHQLGNVLISLDGERAGSESYCTAALRIARPSESGNPAEWQLTVRSRYLDSWSRVNGRWGIDRRQVIREFGDMREVSPIQADGLGRRDRSDPSYAVLAGLLS